MHIVSKTCIITGATSGIGRVTAIELAKQGVNMVLPVRDINKGNILKKEIIEKTGNNEIDIMECDLSSFQSIRSFVSSFHNKYDKLNLLINNAGLWEFSKKNSKEGIELTFAVNHLAPFLLTNLLLGLIKKSTPARIINVSSMAHRFGTINFDDLEGKKNWKSFNSYSQSKLANILFTIKLAELLSNYQITVNCLHPGIIATRLYNKFPKVIIRLAPYFLLTPEKGAETTIYLATSPEVENITGQYFSKKKIKRISREAANKEVADKLWELSLQMTGLNGSVKERR